MITGKTKLIAHVGYPTESFRAPMIYNPYFKKHVIDAVVVPMGCPGVTSMSSRGSLAVRVARASSEMPIPG